MKKLHLTLLVALTICFVTKINAQHKNYDIKNGFGLFGGITQFDIITDNFETTQGNGWIGGMSATVDLPHRWYNVSYGMQLSENNIGILGRSSILDLTPEDIEYKLFTAQVALLFHIKLIGSYVTIDAGPMLQYNSNLELKDDRQENYLIENYTIVTAEDISPISHVNFNGAIGLSAGFSHFRLKAQYIYGFTNMLNKLNDEDFNDIEKKTFKGNQSMLALTTMITF